MIRRLSQTVRTVSYLLFLCMGTLAWPGEVRFDFETGDLQGWRVVEGRFELLVSDRATYHNGGAPYNKEGTFYLSTVEGQDHGSRDDLTGVVESPVFVLDDAALEFLVGGGCHPDAYLALCTLDGQEVRRARGRQIEEMRRVAWRLPELVGEKVFLRVMDNVRQGWGHVTFDDFRASGRIDPEASEERFANRAELLPAPSESSPTDSGEGWVAVALRARADAIASNCRDTRTGGLEGKVVKQGDPAVGFFADISGWDRIVLVADDGGDGLSQDHAVWLDPVLITSDGTRDALSDLVAYEARTGWSGVNRDTDFQGRPLSVAGHNFARGLFAHAPSSVAFALDRDYVRFEARVGVNDTGGAASTVRFHIASRPDAVPSMWQELEKAFPEEAGALRRDLPDGSHLDWLREVDAKPLLERMIAGVLRDLESEAVDTGRFDEAVALARQQSEGEKSRAALLVAYADASRIRAGVENLRATLKAVSPDNIEAAVNNLYASYPDDYLDRGTWLERLEVLRGRLGELERAIAGGEPLDAEKLEHLLSDLGALQHDALAAHPLLQKHPVLYVVRFQYQSKYHAVDTLFHTGEYHVDTDRWHTEWFRGPGALKVIDLSRDHPPRELLALEDGVIRDPDVHFSGERIVFAMRRHREEDYHVYEMDANGSEPRALTAAEGVSDFDPIYLPDDSIVFSSTRDPKYNMCSRDHAANLFRMDPDGANIHQITHNTLFDNHSDLLPDGRILYARWEYVDRNFGDAHSLWTVNPDGTNQALYWGNNTASPGAAFNAHLIPGTPRIVATLGPHHDRLWGALGVIDRRLGVDGRPPVVRTWPDYACDRVRAGGPFDCDGFAGYSPKYEDPWPLDENFFLCARQVGRGEQTGIYLVDLFGNEVLLYTEEPGCYDPMLLAPRPRPPVIPGRRRFTQEPGRFYLADVYEGTHMAGVERGTVKWIRVVESPPKRTWSRGAWFGQGYTAPGMNWHSLENKKVLGRVPVEDDGSAYFEVPSGVFVFFQALDAEGRMVQSMRSGTVLEPGETTGCIGCHEDRLSAPPAPSGDTPLAFRGPPRTPVLFPDEPAEEFSFMAHVQPILDRHCVRCHDYGKPAGEKLNLAGDRDLTFNTAYNELWRKRYVTCVGAGPAEVQPARSWGAAASRMYDVLAKGHRDVELAPEEMARLVTWMDLNGVYYPTYACAFPESLSGRCPLNAEELGRLAGLTGVNFGGLRSYGSNQGPQVTFERPTLSPCLRSTKDDGEKYNEAIALIRLGARRLRDNPRADMEGFKPCAEDERRLAWTAERLRAEQANREAISDGRRVFDVGLSESP